MSYKKLILIMLITIVIIISFYYIYDKSFNIRLENYYINADKESITDISFDKAIKKATMNVYIKDLEPCSFKYTYRIKDKKVCLIKDDGSIYQVFNIEKDKLTYSILVYKQYKKIIYIKSTTDQYNKLIKLIDK